MCEDFIFELVGIFLFFLDLFGSLVCDGGKIFTEQPLFYPRAGVVSVEKSSEHKAESQLTAAPWAKSESVPFSFMRIPREKTFENCWLSNVVKRWQTLSNLVKCCQCMSYFKANCHCSILLILGIAGCTAELPIAIGFSCAMCHVAGASSTPAASGVSNCVCWRFSAWNQKSQPLWRESRHLAPGFLQDFSTKSSRILEEFLMFGYFWQVSEFQMQVTLRCQIVLCRRFRAI